MYLCSSDLCSRAINTTIVRPFNWQLLLFKTDLTSTEKIRIVCGQHPLYVSMIRYIPAENLSEIDNDNIHFCARHDLIDPLDRVSVIKMHTDLIREDIYLREYLLRDIHEQYNDIIFYKPLSL